MKNSKRRQNYSKKKILIISRHLIKKQNDYRWFFIYESSNKFDFINLSYNKYLIKNDKKSFLKKLKKILKTNNIDLFIDLIFPIDLNINNNEYKKNLNYIFEIRELIKNFKIKSLRFNYPLLGRWSLKPWIYLLYLKIFLKIFQNLFLKNYYKFPKSDFICISGEQGGFEIYKTGIKKIFFPHFDYLLLKKEKKDYNFKENYFVYLDQNIQFSHDRKLVNFKSNFSKFENEINNFLFLLKKKFKTKIIIASHPKRDLSKETILTRNWKMVKGNTSKLVSKSNLVIAHDTMSVNYAVLWSKPLIFLTTDQLEKSNYSDSINNYSRYFNKSKINVSKIDINSSKLSKSNLFSIDRSKYSYYKKNFIISKKNKYVDFTKVLNEII